LKEKRKRTTVELVQESVREEKGMLRASGAGEKTNQT